MIEISTFLMSIVEQGGNPRPPHAHGLHYPRFEPTQRAYLKREGVTTQPRQYPIATDLFEIMSIIMTGYSLS